MIMKKNQKKQKNFLHILHAVVAQTLRILFAKPMQSFAKDHTQQPNGAWPVSYVQYARFQHRVRLFSFSFLAVTVASTMTTSVIIEKFFPSYEVRVVVAGEDFAPTATITVQNLKNAGSGSLRNAIANANNGDTITFGNLSGTISLLTALGQITKDITMTGNGNITIDGTSAIGANGNAAHGLSCAAQIYVADITLVNFSGNGIFASDTCDNATLDNVTVSDNGASGIRINGASHVTVRNSTIFGNVSYGIYTSGDLGTIRANTIGMNAAGDTTVGNTDHGIYIVGSTATDNTLSQNTIRYNGASGIFVFTEADRTTITNNTVSNNVTKGIHLRNSNDHSVSGNTIAHNGGDGAMVAASTGTIFTSNIISTNGGTDTNDDTHNGLQFESATAIVGKSDAGNTIVNNIGDGIGATSSTLTITGNALGTDFSNGTGKGNGQHGINMRGASTLTARSNVVAGNSSSGIVLDGSAAASSQHVVTGNRIGIGSGGESLGNSRHGIMLNGTVTDVTIGTDTVGNIIANNTGSAVFVDAQGTTTSGIQIVGNRMFDNSGILPDGSTAPAGVVLLNGANGELAAPFIADCTPLFVAGTTGVAGGTVHLYEADEGNQGKTLLGSVTTGDSGAWSTSLDSWLWADGRQNFDGIIGVVATLTDAANSTSFFSSTCTLTESSPADEEESEDDSTDDDDTTEETPSSEEQQPTTPSEDADDTENTEDTPAEKPEETESSPRTTSFEYLKPQNITVNGYEIFDADQLLPIDSSSLLTIIGRYADAQHHLSARLLLVNAKGEGTVKAADSDIRSEKNGTWKFVTQQKLKLGKVYIVDVQASTTKKTSKRRTLAHLMGAVAAPDLAIDAFTVITEPIVTKTTFRGIVEPSTTARFQLRDDSGDIVASCLLTAEEIEDAEGARGCFVPEQLSEGDYQVYFQTLAGDTSDTLPSAPAIARFIVSDNTPRENFYANPEDERFYQRVTTTATPSVYGLAPIGVDVRLTLDDVALGTATRDSVGWSMALDLSALPRTQHTLTIEFFRAGTPAQPTLIFPFLFAPELVTPTITTPQTLTVDVASSVEFCGGNGNTATITIDDAQFIRTFDENVQDVHACTTLTVTPSDAGILTLAVMAEDANGLQGTVTTTATVQAAQSLTTPREEEEETTEEEDGEETTSPREPTPPSSGPESETEVNPLPSSSPEEQEASAAADEEGTSSAGQDQDQDATGESADASEKLSLTFPPYDDAVPEIYRQEETSAQEREVIERKLRKDVTQSLKVVAATVIRDTNGNILHTVPIAPNKRGEVLLHATRSVGLPEIFSRQRLPRKEDIVILSGTTAPGAAITVIIRSDPIVKVTRADSEGKWTLTIPAAVLPEGEHSAFLQTSSRGVTSDVVEIVRFVIVQEDRISNTTWILMSNIFVGTLALLIGVTLQIRKRRNMLEHAALAVNADTLPASNAQNPQKGRTSPHTTKSFLSRRKKKRNVLDL